MLMLFLSLLKSVCCQVFHLSPHRTSPNRGAETCTRRKSPRQHGCGGSCAQSQHQMRRLGESALTPVWCLRSVQAVEAPTSHSAALAGTRYRVRLLSTVAPDQEGEAPCAGKSRRNPLRRQRSGEFPQCRTARSGDPYGAGRNGVSTTATHRKTIRISVVYPSFGESHA